MLQKDEYAIAMSANAQDRRWFSSMDAHGDYARPFNILNVSFL